MARRLQPLGFWLAVCLLLASCAIPVSPTGGPADQTPPAIASSTPAAQSVLVQAEALELVFTEYVDQASFAQAVSITPEFARPPVYRWRKKAVTLTFPEPLAENTTYIITIDTKLRDQNRVALKQPITLAFSTGPQINRGKLAGRVVDAADGAPLGTIDVFAYAAPSAIPPDSLPERPSYRTQTDNTGQFTFDYLSEQPYFVIALRDQNRNLSHDATEPFAVPPTPVIVADSAGTAPDRPWVLTRQDTLPPTIQRVRALSTTRLTLRLSESIQLLDPDPARWAVRDSTNGQAIAVASVYLQPEDPRQVLLVTAPMQPARHLLIPGGLADSSGNPVRPDTLSFNASTTADTVVARFVSFIPTAQPGATAQDLLPGQHPGVRISAPADVRGFASLMDSVGTSYPYQVNTPDGVTFFLRPEPPAPSGRPITLRIDGAGLNRPDTMFTRTYRYPGAEALGELSGVVHVEADSTGTARVALIPYTPPPAPLPVAQVDGDGRFLFQDLPAQTRYRFLAFLDRNDNLMWDGGTLLPYVPAEPIHWSTDSLTVRARWESELADTLRIR